MFATAVGMALVASAQGASPAVGGGTQYGPTFVTASSSAFTVGVSSSVRLLSTTTRSARMAVDIQTLNCAAGSVLFLMANGDNVAVANTGRYVSASSTVSFATAPSASPAPQGAVQGITSVGECTVLVTEWRTIYR